MRTTWTRRRRWRCCGKIRETRGREGRGRHRWRLGSMVRGSMRRLMICIGPARRRRARSLSRTIARRRETGTRVIEAEVCRIWMNWLARYVPHKSSKELMLTYSPYTLQLHPPERLRLQSHDPYHDRLPRCRADLKHRPRPASQYRPSQICQHQRKPRHHAP